MHRVVILHYCFTTNNHLEIRIRLTESGGRTLLVGVEDRGNQRRLPRKQAIPACSGLRPESVVLLALPADDRPVAILVLCSAVLFEVTVATRRVTIVIFGSGQMLPHEDRYYQSDQDTS